MRVRVEELLAQVTGGESFVYVQPLRKAGKVRYFVRQAGLHPSYDVVVRVQEVRQRPDGKKVRLLLLGPAEVGRTLRRGSGFDWTYPDPTRLTDAPGLSCSRNRPHPPQRPGHLGSSLPLGTESSSK
jgi:hypothetical protein